MAGVERALAQPVRLRAGGSDGRHWLRLGLAVAGLAALAISGLIAAQEDPPANAGIAAAAATGDNGYDRWASPGPRWRPRSQTLEDAGILSRP